MPLINFKVELKLRWTQQCISSVLDNENDNANADSNDIIFTIKDTKLYVTVVTVSVQDNQKLSKLHSKEFETSVYWIEYKTENANENTTNKYRYFIESDFVGVNRLFVLISPNQDNSVKRFKGKKYYLPKNIIKKLNVIVN